MNYRNDIQGLRAIAVLFVFLFHLSSKFLPGGFIGVDIFFVISGYLISKIILSKIDKEKFSLLDFYIGRVKRIVPAYYFLLIVVWVLFLFVFTNADVALFKLSHFWAVLFNSNNYFGKVDDYFGASSSENPLLHTWTLAIEMQFYFILPLFLLLIKNRRILIIVIFVATFFLFGYSTFEIAKGNRTSMYFSLLARSPEFFLGVLASLFGIEKRRFFIRNASIISFIGIVGLLCSALFLNESTDFPGVYAAIPCLATVLLLATPSSKINIFLSKRSFAYIGEMSYSVYLWHWPIMAFLRYYNFRYDFTLFEMVVVTVLTIITSLLSYYLIERPLRVKMIYKFLLPLLTLGTVNVAMVYFVKPIKNKVSNMPLEYLYPSFGMDSNANEFERVGSYGAKKGIYNKRILLLGDSHAHGFKPYLNELGRKKNFSFRSVTNSFYPTIPTLVGDENHDDSKFTTYQKLKPYIESEVDSADIIIVYFAANHSHLWVDPTSRFLSSLKKSQKVLFVSDYPSLDKNPGRLNRSFIKDKSKKQIYKLTFHVMDTKIMDMIEKNPNAEYVDLSGTRSFFDDAPFYRDTLMYFDSTHLNYFGATRYEDVSGDEFMKYLSWGLKD